jgi:hypothetical protein
MSNTKDITIDPITQKEFDEAAGAAFDAFVEALGDIDYSEMDYQEIAQTFFFNGFYRGCMAMTDNPDLQETIHMMAEETKYQMKEK